MRDRQIRGQLVEHDQGGRVPDQLDPITLAHRFWPVDPMVSELLCLVELLGNVSPDEIAYVASVHGGDLCRLCAHSVGDRGGELPLEFREPGQKAEGDHIVCLTAPHRLTQLEDGLLTLSGETFERPTQEFGHPAGHMVASVEGASSRNIGVNNRG